MLLLARENDLWLSIYPSSVSAINGATVGKHECFLALIFGRAQGTGEYL